MALVTTQSKPFMQLVDLQKKSLDALNTIKDVAVAQQIDKQNSKDLSVQNVVAMKELARNMSALKEAAKQMSAEKRALVDISKSLVQIRSLSDRFKDLKSSIEDNLNPLTMKKTFFGAFNVGGIFNKKLQEIDFTKRQKAWGVGGTDKENATNFKNAVKIAKLLEAQNVVLERWKKEAGLKSNVKDSEIRKSPVGASILKKRDDLASQYAQYDKAAGMQAKSITPTASNNIPSAADAANKMGGNVSTKSAPLPKTPSDTGKVSQSTTDLLAEQQQSKENQLESIRLQQAQVDLLTQIAANTSRGSDNSSAGGKEDAGGSPADGQGAGFLGALKGIAKGMGTMGQGLGAMVGNAIGALFSGILKGLAVGLAAFASVKTIIGVAVLGGLTYVITSLGEALDTFSKLDWDTLAKAGLTLAALIGAAALAGTFIAPIALGTVALLGMAGAVWAIGEAMNAMGEGLQSFVDGLERLSNVQGDKLMSVADGLKSLSAAFLAFGAGQAAEGLGNLVSRFLTIGTDSPVDRLLKIGDAGPGVQAAGEGLGKLSDAMKNFAKVDSDSMKAVKDFPWEQATKFVAAGGSMTIKGTQVYNASKGNADEQAKADGSKSAATNNSVQATVQNNSTTQMNVRPSVRNTESSQQRYIDSRF